ncbi:uncharacterized protein AMSG_05008 [Thecamonas trahens ATCC 50062]|uniref:Uncharacterized protein n=1 Tax=Thecamonas trahens ATCC 50062 TaxID=461836 RepID=A0A0L0DCK7_THETB|nr:hypothetical protein AMSG_05008 [Thecamonas trahens ATCC 50062]KNC49048.1 hypothetical protein AMSG_05008 [Thecamonas trahens ATCC 50062]|eukprot:XP_013758083.1 hypothetical protein AMSG_05008 [Thecamonas trahens ATCC 50062]
MSCACGIATKDLSKNSLVCGGCGNVASATYGRIEDAETDARTMNDRLLRCKVCKEVAWRGMENANVEKMKVNLASGSVAPAGAVPKSTVVVDSAPEPAQPEPSLADLAADW